MSSFFVLTDSRRLLGKRRADGLGEGLAVRDVLDPGEGREKLRPGGRQGLERVGKRVHG